MSWVTIEEAVKVRGSRATWNRWITTELVATKIVQNRRFVWLSLDTEAILNQELENHREERRQFLKIIASQTAQIKGLETTLSHAETAQAHHEPTQSLMVIQETHRETQPCLTVRQPLRINPPTSRDQLLNLINQTWSGSDAELERLAGAPRGWIWRQRKFSKEGKPTSKRGKKTRQKLLSYLKDKKAA